MPGRPSSRTPSNAAIRAPPTCWSTSKFCGICHSDLHTARDEWGGTKFPCVPGHEIVGKVARVGAQVSKFKAGDTVGVGCFVGSCGECEQCKQGLENYCQKGATGTYNAKDSHGEKTYGGYSKAI